MNKLGPEERSAVGVVRNYVNPALLVLILLGLALLIGLVRIHQAQYANAQRKLRAWTRDEVRQILWNQKNIAEHRPLSEVPAGYMQDLAVP